MSIERLARKLAGQSGARRKYRMGQVASFAAASPGPPPVPPTVNLSLPGVFADDGSQFILAGVPYAPTYAPTVADWVWIDTSSPDWFVIGKQA